MEKSEAIKMVNMVWFPIIIIGWILGISGIIIGVVIELYIQKGSFDGIFIKSNIIMWILVCLGLVMVAFV